MGQSPEFLIDGILPAGEAHLIGGASGSGKTTWIFQDLLAPFIKGDPVLGHDSHPVPYLYLSMDRSRTSVTRTLSRLGLNNQITRVICLDEMPANCLSLKDILKFGLSKYPDSKLFIIEGFALIAGERTNGYTAVGHLMRQTARLCVEQGMTIIGICHAPKMKTDESFQHSRELLLGSVAWAAYSDTIIVLNMDELTSVITVKVMPRNAAMEAHSLRFGANGVLEPVTKATKTNLMCIKIASLSEGSPVTRQEIIQWGTRLSVALRTCDRAIKICVENKVLESIGEGIYERSDSPLPAITPDSDITID